MLSLNYYQPLLKRLYHYQITLKQRLILSLELEVFGLYHLLLLLEEQDPKRLFNLEYNIDTYQKMALNHQLRHSKWIILKQRRLFLTGMNSKQMQEKELITQPLRVVS